MSKRNISEALIKSLWAKSGGRCAICKTEIIMKQELNSPTPIGEMAHIEGLKPDSPRYNPNMTDKERNSHDNLMILCPTCHTKIDKNLDYYTVEKLKQIKYEHEKWVDEQLRVTIPEVSFAELDVITKYLISAPSSEESLGNLALIPTKDKIKRNDLSDHVSNLVTMGLMRVKQVKDYLNKNPDPEFANRLRNGFVQKYLELKEQRIDGDELFYGLLQFASQGSVDFKVQAAGLSVLTYFFEICEVFEK